MGTDSIVGSVYTLVTGLTGFQAYAMIIIILFACGLGLPVPEDITLFAAGFLAFKGQISLSGAFVVGMVGVLVGDSFMYWIGRAFGRKVVHWPLFRKMLTADRIEKAERKIQNNARIICFTSRFAPGLRAPIFLTAGILRIPFHIFLTMDSLAAVISVPVWITLAYFLGDHIESLLEIAGSAKMGAGILLLVLIVGYILFKFRKRLFSKRLFNN